MLIVSHFTPISCWVCVRYRVRFNYNTPQKLISCETMMKNKEIYKNFGAIKRNIQIIRVIL